MKDYGTKELKIRLKEYLTVIKRCAELIKFYQKAVQSLRIAGNATPEELKFFNQLESMIKDFNAKLDKLEYPT